MIMYALLKLVKFYLNCVIQDVGSARRALMRAGVKLSVRTAVQKLRDQYQYKPV